MKITIKTTNLKLTPAIKRTLEEKIGTLDKFIPHLDGSLEGFVEIAVETKHHHKGEIFYSEANIRIGKKIIRAESREKNLYYSINSLKDRLQAELKKYKEKKLAKKRKASRTVKEKIKNSLTEDIEEENNSAKD